MMVVTHSPDVSDPTGNFVTDKRISLFNITNLNEYLLNKYGSNVKTITRKFDGQKVKYKEQGKKQA